jgi:hypothetical protein
MSLELVSQKSEHEFHLVPCYDEAIVSFVGKDTSLNSFGTNPKHQWKGLSSALIRASESKV